MAELVASLPEYTDFGKLIQVKENQERLDHLKLSYLQGNTYLAIVGYIRLEDFARFTSQEDQRNDQIDAFGQRRIYLTGLKRRAVYRRISEGILRAHKDDYSCATPDHQCLECYNCYAYGGVRAIKDQQDALRSRFKPTTAFSIQAAEDALADEEEFHAMTHRDLKMPTSGEGASIYNLHLIRPGVVFPFIDFIFQPCQFDLAIYFETLRQAEKSGFGSMTSRLGTVSINCVGVSADLALGQADLLKDMQVNADGTVDVDARLTTGLEKVDGSDLRSKLKGWIETYKGKIFGGG
ncbi:MAG: type I-D CRISPR-associated protein Cas7/Csc2 [Chloroflexi bacterium]|nr:type I-D CRISPR-associated protein Cas7/Csc2 [Chloroflexota bacterium]